MELEALVKEEGETRENLKVFEEDVKANPEDVGKVKELQKQLKAAEAELEKARAKSDAVEATCKDLQDQIMNAGGDKLRMQKKKVSGIKPEKSFHFVHPGIKVASTDVLWYRWRV
jgi:structural maintenance of chromosome 4